ncbi:MAG: hypothetical protein ACE361_18080 [Aureliella sp.]
MIPDRPANSSEPKTVVTTIVMKGQNAKPVPTTASGAEFWQVGELSNTNLAPSQGRVRTTERSSYKAIPKTFNPHAFSARLSLAEQELKAIGWNQLTSSISECDNLSFA